MTSSHPTASEPAYAAGLNPLRMPPESLRPFATAGGRRYERTGERELERLDGAIRTSKAFPWNPVRIRDYSQQGFGVVALHPADWTLPREAQSVDLRVNGPWNRDLILPCEVRNLPGTGEGNRLGLKRLDLLDTPPAGNESGHTLKPASRLEVRIENPILYQEWASATLVGFGARREWIFRSIDPSLLLLRELPLRVQFDLPLESDGISNGEVLWVAMEAGSEGLAFGIRWTAMPFEVSNGVGEFLLRAEGLTPAELRPYGVCMRGFREQLRFTVVSTREEYQKVLYLRREAHGLTGKTPRDTDHPQKASRFDDHDRILAAFHGDELAACLGLTFPKDSDSLPRSETLFPGKAYPVRLPPKAKMIEAHAFHTRPEYWGADLIKGMFEQVARCLILSDREWILTLATAELWPLYRRIGFRKVGASVKVDFLGGLEHHLILVHRDAWAAGRRMSPRDWNYFFGDLVRTLQLRGYLELPPGARARVAALSLLRGFGRRRTEARMESEFRNFPCALHDVKLTGVMDSVAAKDLD